MARNAEHREDLILEATALVDRIELQIPETSEEASQIIFAGFRNNGFLSIYFGQDLHYQFDLDGRLRRAFVDPDLYRASYGKLSRLERRSSDAQTVLVRTDLNVQQSLEFINDCQQRLHALRRLLTSDNASVLRFVAAKKQTTTADLLNRLSECLQNIITRTEDFFSQTIKGKRLK